MSVILKEIVDNFQMHLIMIMHLIIIKCTLQSLQAIFRYWIWPDGNWKPSEALWIWPCKSINKKEALWNIKMNTINIENISNACIKGSHSWSSLMQKMHETPSRKKLIWAENQEYKGQVTSEESLSLAQWVGSRWGWREEQENKSGENSDNSSSSWTKQAQGIVAALRLMTISVCTKNPTMNFTKLGSVILLDTSQVRHGFNFLLSDRT